MTGFAGVATTGVVVIETAFETVGLVTWTGLSHAEAATAHTAIKAANCISLSPP